MTLHASSTQTIGSNKVKVKILAATVCDPFGDVPAGAVVEVDIDEFHRLQQAGKATVASIEEQEPAAPAEPTPEEIEALRANLEGKTKAELVNEAADLGLDLDERMTKAEMVAAILENKE